MSGSKKLKMWPTDDRWIPWNFNYWLTCLWCTFLTEHEVTNKVTFSTLHSTHNSWSSLRACLSTELVSLSFLFCSLQRLSTHTWKFFQQLLCYVSFKQRQIFNQNVVFWIAVLKHSSDVISTISIHHFHYPENLQNKVSKRELWCEVKNAFRSQHYQDIPSFYKRF